MTLALFASLAFPPTRHVYIPAWDSCSGENCKVLVYVLPLIVTEDTVTPEGSEALFEPKNHAKLGVGTF